MPKSVDNGTAKPWPARPARPFAGGRFQLKKRFTVALSGLSDADTALVRQALQAPQAQAWDLAEGVAGDLLVVDVDSVWGHMDWLRATAAGQRTAAYSEQSEMRDCDMMLSKPMQAQELLAALQAVADGAPGTVEPAAAAPAPRPAAAKVEAAVQAAEPAPAPAAPVRAERAAPTATVAEPAAAPANPEATTVGALLLSGGIDRPSLVQAPDGTRLVIDPRAGNYHASPQLKPLRALLELPTATLQPLAADDPAAQHVGPPQPLGRLLWFAALCASPGRLAPPLDERTAYRLARWPQIEREFPRHFRIATTMMKQAGTLQELAAASSTPAEDVADFINAYFVAGYVAAEGEETTSVAQGAGVLSRLRRPFARGQEPA